MSSNNGTPPIAKHPSEKKGTSEEETQQGWRKWLTDLSHASGNIPGAFRLVWVASPGMTLLMLGLTVLGGALPAAQAWMAKLVVDQAVELLQAGKDAWSGLPVILPLLSLEFGLLLLDSISSQARSFIERILNSKLNQHINLLIIRKALALDLTAFEDAAFYDKLQNARREADSRALRIVIESFRLIQNIIKLFSFVLLLIRFSPWLTVILFGATVPSFIVQKKYGQLHFRLLSGQAPERRKREYIEHILTVDNFVKEIKLFGVGKLLVSRYIDLFWQLFREDVALAKRRSLASVGWGLVALFSYYFCYSWIILSIVNGTITFGDALMYVTVFERSQSTFQALSSALSELYESSLFLSNLFGYLEVEAQITSPLKPHPMPTRIQQSIEFRNVSFRYPGGSDWALRHVNLTLYPGEKVALVGTNGAGKTTMIKLLTRLYDPTEGQILIDGMDLRHYDLAEWRQNIGVIFQDFVRYQLTASENIGFGQVNAINDRSRILDAARKGGADDVLSALPKGYDTVLGKWFEGGHELSGGQWQKVALSRAFMRDAEVLVLDEPTAALDAKQEYLIFQRFRELTDDKVAILISHRFSTVRLADRIAVIENGAISELGSHDELMAQNGTYADLFTIQAQGYR